MSTFTEDDLTQCGQSIRMMLASNTIVESRMMGRRTGR